MAVHYECSSCKEHVEAPLDVPTQMIGDWRMERRKKSILTFLYVPNAFSLINA